MLSFEEFDFELMRALDEKYPDMKKKRKMRYRFNETKVGIVLEGPNGIEPIVYPDNLYEAYKEMEDMDLIMGIIESAIEYEKVNGFKNIVKDWNQAKEYIYPYIVNMEKNQLCMDYNGYVYKPKLDFAYGVYVELPDVDGVACVNITKDMLHLWNVSEEELFEIAEKNAKYYVKPMKQVIAELLDKEITEIDVPEDDAMYVITNAMKNRGAAGLFDLDLLRKTAEELQSDFFILPSSMHEIILVLETSAPSKQMLKESVEDVNQCQVKEEEYLSDNVYYYSRESHEVSIVEFD